MGWTLHANTFGTTSENLPKSFQNIVLMLSIIVFVANVVTHGVQVKDESNSVSLNHHPTFIDLWDSSNKDAIIPIFIHPLKFSLLNSFTFDASLQSYKEVAIIFGLSSLILYMKTFGDEK